MPPVSAKLSEEARRGLRRFCKEQGINLTAFIEAIGLTFDERGTLDLDEVVARARDIVADRLAR